MATPVIEPQHLADVASARKQFVGRTLAELPTPAAVVDRRIAAAHCDAMLNACRELGLGLRAHIKTHKVADAISLARPLGSILSYGNIMTLIPTLEGTQLQVGHDSPDIRLVVSTLPEIAQVMPWLVEEEAKGRSVSVLYSMPLPPSTIPTLNRLVSRLSSGSLALMIDHPSHLAHLSSFTHPPRLFIKLDTGSHRAGLPAESGEFASLANAAVAAHVDGKAILHGVYSHASHSYAVRTADEAMLILKDELDECTAAASVVRNCLGIEAVTQPLVLSVGATPSASAAQNLTHGVATGTSPAAEHLRKTFASLEADPAVQVELHAGVYPFLDLQQLSTQAAPSSVAPTPASSPGPSLTTHDIALTILAEVCSAYPHRSPPQALVAAGTLALGREPCPRYTGFGAVSAWSLHTHQIRAHAAGWGGAGARDGPAPATGSIPALERSGWVVGKVSQEHGVLMPEEASGWEGSAAGPAEVPFEVGQKVRILTNHACIAGSGYPWYFVVDGGDEVVELWERCKGW